VTSRIDDLRDPGILRELNNAAAPDVNQIDERKADWLLTHSALARMAIVDGHAAGVIVVLGDASNLESDYFRWFTDRYENFLYIDRVIVAETVRRCGLATRLYREVDELARSSRMAIASEVYSQPPNIPSLNFHRKMGYREVGQQFSNSEGKMVSKLMKFGGRARPRRPPSE
jgi:predicted GNAT superfamily acetyltransferase